MLSSVFVLYNMFASISDVKFASILDTSPLNNTLSALTTLYNPVNSEYLPAHSVHKSDINFPLADIDDSREISLFFKSAMSFSFLVIRLLCSANHDDVLSSKSFTDFLASATDLSLLIT